MANCSTEEAYIRRIVEEETEAMREEINRLRREVQRLSGAIESLSQGYKPCT
jgi:predicted translin family RNA/ssDNA-binding protein